MILSERRKYVTTIDVAQKAGVSAQMVSRVMNKFSYVFGEICQYVKAMAGQYEILKSAYFSLTIIPQDLQLFGEQVIQSIVEMIRAWQKSQAVIARSRAIQQNFVVHESSKRG